MRHMYSQWDLSMSPYTGTLSKNMHSWHKCSLAPTVCQALFWALGPHKEPNQTQSLGLHIIRTDTEINGTLQLWPAYMYGGQ